MFYQLVSPCGCTVRVACDRETGVVHTRVIEEPGDTCRNRRHRIGARFWVWELLPAGADRAGQARLPASA